VKYFLNLLSSIVLFILLAQVGRSAELAGIEIDCHKYYDTVTINTSEYIKPKVMLLDNPSRLVVDLTGIKIKTKTFPKIKSKRITKVRTGSSTRIVFDLAYSVDYEEASIFGQNKVVIEVRDKSRPYVHNLQEEPAADPVAPVMEVKKVAPQIVRVERVVVREEVESDNGRGGSQTRPYSKVLKGKIIVIDPGHGGADPGAFGIGGLVEKNLTLKTANYLVEFLKQQGATVYLTRKKNVKIDLAEVTAFTNRIDADIYVGLHYNATYNSRMNGTETYYYTARSLKLAEIMHKNLREKLGRRDNGVRRAKLYTVHHALMPAVIVEPCYLTNPEEANLAASDRFLKKVAAAVSDGIKEYFNGGNRKDTKVKH